MVDLSYSNKAVKILSSIRGLLKSSEIAMGRLDESINNLDELISEASDLNSLANWQNLLTGLRLYRSREKLKKLIEDDNSGFIEEKEKLKYLKSEFIRLNNNLNREEKLKGIFDEKEELFLNLKRLRALLNNLDYPNLYYAKDKDDNKIFFPRAQKSTQEKEKKPLIKLIAFLDGSPLVSPSIVRPNLNFQLKFEIKGIHWPEDALSIKFDLLTTLQSKEYSISDFILEKPRKINDDKYQALLNGNILFKSEQSLLSEKISFIVRAAFQFENNDEKEVQVVGHNSLEFKVLSKSKNEFSSGYKNIDSHVHSIFEELIKEQVNVKDELSELLSVSSALSNLLGRYAQGAVFKNIRTLGESEFQAKIRDDLRGILGNEVKEHIKQSGGFTDLVYKDVIIELKVEKENGDRDNIAKKYSKQSTQYQAVESRQVSIVVVLDLTPKINPIGDLRNNIILANVPTHGGANKKYPSKTLIFIFDGNLKNPSDYSK